MSKASYWQRGEALDYTNSTDEVIENGTIIELAERIGVAGCDIAPDTTTPGSVHVTGVYAIDKTDSTEEIAAGASVYYDGTGVTAADSSGTPAGWVVQDSASGDTQAYVKIG